MTIFEVRRLHDRIWVSHWGSKGKRTGPSDNLALLFRLGHTLKTAEKQLRSVHNGELNAEMLHESLLDLLALVETHHAYIRCVSIQPPALNSNDGSLTVVDQNGVEAVTWVQF